MPGVDIIMSLVGTGSGPIIGSIGEMEAMLLNTTTHASQISYLSQRGRINYRKPESEWVRMLELKVNPDTHVLMFNNQAVDVINREFSFPDFKKMWTEPAEEEDISSPMHHLADVLRKAKLDQPTAILGMSNSERLSVEETIVPEPSPTPELLIQQIQGWKELFQATREPWESLGEAKQAKLERNFLETIRTYSALRNAPKSERPASDLIVSAVNTLAAVAAFHPELAGRLAEKVVDGVQLELGSPTDNELKKAIAYVNDVTRQIAEDPTRASTLVSSNLHLSFARTMVVLATRLKGVSDQDRITFAKNQLASPLYYIPGLLKGIV